MQKFENFDARAMTELEIRINPPKSYDNYVCTIEPFRYKDETLDLVVIGFVSFHIYMRRERDTSLDHTPRALAVRKVSPKGKVSSQIYRFYLSPAKSVRQVEQMPNELWEKFMEIYESHAASKVRHMHRIEFMNSAVKEYGGYGWSWSQIPECVQRAFEEFDFYTHISRSYADMEERRKEARLRILEAQQQMYAGSSWLNACFNAASIARPVVSNSSWKEDVKREYAIFAKRKSEIRKAHKYEDMFQEHKEMVLAEARISRILRENERDIPRNGLGFINWDEILK